MSTWKAYWIMRNVEAYLIGHSSDADALAIVSKLVDLFEREQAKVIPFRSSGHI